MFKPDWWLQHNRLGGAVDAGEKLKESKPLRYLIGLIVGAISFYLYNQVLQHTLNSSIFIGAIFSLLGSAIPVIGGFAIENGSKALAYVLAYLTVALAGVTSLAVLAAVGYFVLGVVRSGTLTQPRQGSNGNSAAQTPAVNHASRSFAQRTTAKRGVKANVATLSEEEARKLLDTVPSVTHPGNQGNVKPPAVPKQQPSPLDY